MSQLRKLLSKRPRLQKAAAIIRFKNGYNTDFHSAKLLINQSYLFSVFSGNLIQSPIILDEIGMPDVRFHDLRHSYAVASIRAGDDIKTVQENLGHATAAFTLDVYGHVTDQMKRDSANRMQKYIQNVSR